jgi:hypothetical protein
MKKLLLLVSVSAALMAVKCASQQPASKTADGATSIAEDSTAQPMTDALVADSLAGNSISPTDSLADGGIISPNHSPNQSKLDSIKKEKAKDKKKHAGGGGDNN